MKRLLWRDEDHGWARPTALDIKNYLADWYIVAWTPEGAAAVAAKISLLRLVREYLAAGQPDVVRLTFDDPFEAVSKEHLDELDPEENE